MKDLLAAIAKIIAYGIMTVAAIIAGLISRDGATQFIFDAADQKRQPTQWEQQR